MAGRGRKVLFHGAFGSSAAAHRKKARVRGGFIKRIRVRGDVRYVVMSRRAR